MLLELLMGVSLQTQPENGTWWDQAYGSTKFRQASYAAGLGVRGEHWAIEAQDLGNEYSHYIDQFGYHWDGHQHPRGAWAIWEPGKTIYGRLGVGADKSNFVLQSTYGPNGGYTAANAHWAPSGLAGVGLRIANHVAAVFDVRYVYAGVKGIQTTGNVPNLGKFAGALQMRFSF